MQKRQDSSAFFTNNIGAENGDVVGQVMPWSNMTTHCHSSSSFWSCGTAAGTGTAGLPPVLSQEVNGSDDHVAARLGEDALCCCRSRSKKGWCWSALRPTSAGARVLVVSPHTAR